MRIAADTNALVSGLLSPFGPPGVVVSLIAAGRLSLCYDARMLAEYAGVLRRPSFPFAGEEIAGLIEQIRVAGELIAPLPLADRLRDPDDEPFLEVAVAGNVEFLVTGNRKHFPSCGPYAGRIVSPREFLAALTSSRNTDE